MTVKVFKIQFPDGSYSKGGTDAEPSKKGKGWTSIGALKSHLNLVTATWASKGRGWRRDPTAAPLEAHPYEGAKLVTFELVEAETRPVPFREYVARELAEADESAERWGHERDKQQAQRLRAWLEPTCRICLNRTCRPTHPIVYATDDTDQGRRCFRCGFPVPGGFRHAHELWCKNHD